MTSNGMDKEAWLKINDMISYRNMADGIVLIKFCENLADLEEFELNFDMDTDEPVEQDQVEEAELPTSKREMINAKNNLVNHVLFIIKLQTVTCSMVTNAQSAVKLAIKKNTSNLSKLWYISILYVRIVKFLFRFYRKFY